MKFKLTLICCTLFLVSNGIFAGVEYVCKHGNAERIISIYYENNEAQVPCEVQYDKGEGVETLWRAQLQVGYCESKADEFVEKQELWGWSCEKSTHPDDADDLYTNLY